MRMFSVLDDSSDATSSINEAKLKMTTKRLDMVVLKNKTVARRQLVRARACVWEEKKHE